ncbi:MAG: dTDP-4-keto-6-deoxy-D-glucose epimerase [Gemmatimonadetes bacterium]|nr:dTDP-4-keto-6-deoxy-D-glucose epimerase [Gemmatimonadota bacterium]
MRCEPTTLEGYFEVQPPVHADARGRLIKTFDSTAFEALGLASMFSEHYFSESARGVLRGLHFQAPPHVVAKLVYCIRGRVLDVALDLRASGPTYGQIAMVELDAERGNGVFVAEWLAHGFLALTDQAIVSCSMTGVYQPASDAGIRWDSAGISWPHLGPQLSEKDRHLPRFSEFRSPFR